MKASLIVLSLIFSYVIADNEPKSSDPRPADLPKEDVVLEVGQIYPGKIDIAKERQALHYVKVKNLEDKFLFIRFNTADKVRMGVGIYSNETKQLVHSCEDSEFDTCYISSTNLKPNSVYVVLVVVSDTMQYNFYTYWSDIQHLRGNERIKFMFEEEKPTQLYHLEFSNMSQVQQIRIALRPEAQRVQGDNLKIFANLGFNEDPSVQKHDIASKRVWADSQAIILTKDQFQGQSGLSLFIVGRAQTVYILDVEFLNTLTHELNIEQIVNDYLAANKTVTYKMNFHIKSNETFVIKIASFNGEMATSFFYDEKLTEPFQTNSNQYMSDMQINLRSTDMKPNTTALYLKVQTYDMGSAYQITTQIRESSFAYEMTENVFEFAIIQAKKQQAMFFYSHLWDGNQYEKVKSLKFDVSAIYIAGQPVIKYYYCPAGSADLDCVSVGKEGWKKTVKEIIPSSRQEIGQKRITTLDVDDDVYKKVNNVEKRLVIIVTIESEVESAVALEFSNPNQVRYLREGRAFEDRVGQKENKYYKYVNSNEKVSQIRIHINEITGLTKVRATRYNMLAKNLGPDTDRTTYTLDLNLSDTLIIKQKTTQPIYIQVFGYVKSLYTVSVSAIHMEHLVSNSLVMAEDIQYEVKLLPFQHMNVELHPIQGQITFEFYAEGGMVMACEVDARDLCVDNKTFASSGKIEIDTTKKREVRIRIGNFVDPSLFTPSAQSLILNASKPFLPKNENINRVKLTLIYHGTGNPHCQQRRVNKVYAENLSPMSCFSFHIPVVTDVQVMAVRSDLGQFGNMLNFCGRKVTASEINDRLVVKKEHIEEACKNKMENVVLIMVVTDKHMIGEVKLQYSVELKADIITLLEGVAYSAQGFSTPETSLRNFFYQILNQDRDINILLYNKKGYQKFYASLVNRTDKYFNAITEATAQFTSKSSNYYRNPYIQVSADSIKKADCGRVCVLSLSVYSTEKSGSEYQYALEITQNHLFLKEDHLKEDFLAKGSVRFYEYEAKDKKGSVVFKVSDNNRKCAKIIMSKNPFPTGSNYFAQDNEGTLIFDKQRKQTEYFAVEAINDCPYTVTITQSQQAITKIEYGQYYDIDLAEGEQKWFYTRHVSSSTFKIINLKEHGQIQIFANRTELTKQVFTSIEDKKIDRNSFHFQSSYKNTLVIQKDNRYFCSNCYYLICVYATKMTKGSIFLGSENSKISLSDEKILFDEIVQKNATTYGTYYKVSDGDLLVKVHSGAIKLQITYEDEKFSKSFVSSKKVYHETYNFTKNPEKYEPLQIHVTAEQTPALYSFELKPVELKGNFNYRVTPGEHSYVYLNKGKPSCVTGRITDIKDEIYVSIDASEKYNLADLGVVLTVDEAVTENYNKEIVGNIMAIHIKSQEIFMQKPKNYKICFSTEPKNNVGLSLYIFQSQGINLIHSDSEILVRKAAKYVLYPSRDIILDLFECRGSAELYYSSSLEKLREKPSHKLDMIGIPGQSHAIRIAEMSTLYLEVIADMATVLWMPLIEREERGVGYFKYAIGGLEYRSSFNSLEFNIGGVYKNKETKTKPVSVKYTLYIANSSQLLQEAVMCQKSSPDKLYSITHTTTEVGKSPSYTITIKTDKQKISKIFSTIETLYWNIVADLTLQPPNATNSSFDEDHQHYRFVYYQQVVPSQVFRQNKLESLQLQMLIALIVAFVLGVVIIGCLFVKLIVPAIGRLRNRVLVEQKDDPRDQSIPLPPTSDRNEIQNNAVGGTDEAMK